MTRTMRIIAISASMLVSTGAMAGQPLKTCSANKVYGDSPNELPLTELEPAGAAIHAGRDHLHLPCERDVRHALQLPNRTVEALRTECRNQLLNLRDRDIAAGDQGPQIGLYQRCGTNVDPQD